MAISFYDLSVPTFLQIVRAVEGFLGRTVTHCAEIGADPDDFVRARLFEDMAPFHFQIEAAWHHAVWGLEAGKTGVFAPPALVGPVPFAELRAMMGKAETSLEVLTPARSTAERAKNSTFRSARGDSPSPRRLSSCRFRYRTSISTPSPPMTSSARKRTSELAIDQLACSSS